MQILHVLCVFFSFQSLFLILKEEKKKHNFIKKKKNTPQPAFTKTYITQEKKRGGAGNRKIIKIIKKHTLKPALLGAKIFRPGKGEGEKKTTPKKNKHTNKQTNMQLVKSLLLGFRIPPLHHSFLYNQPPSSNSTLPFLTSRSNFGISNFGGGSSLFPFFGLVLTMASSLLGPSFTNSMSQPSSLAAPTQVDSPACTLP